MTAPPSLHECNECGLEDAHSFAASLKTRYPKYEPRKSAVQKDIKDKLENALFGIVSPDTEETFGNDDLQFTRKTSGGNYRRGQSKYNEVIIENPTVSALYVRPSKLKQNSPEVRTARKLAEKYNLPLVDLDTGDTLVFSNGEILDIAKTDLRDPNALVGELSTGDRLELARRVMKKPIFQDTTESVDVGGRKVKSLGSKLKAELKEVISELEKADNQAGPSRISSSVTERPRSLEPISREQFEAERKQIVEEFNEMFERNYEKTKGTVGEFIIDKEREEFHKKIQELESRIIDRAA